MEFIASQDCRGGKDEIGSDGFTHLVYLRQARDVFANVLRDDEEVVILRLGPSKFTANGIDHRRDRRFKARVSWRRPPEQRHKPLLGKRLEDVLNDFVDVIPLPPGCSSNRADAGSSGSNEAPS